MSDGHLLGTTVGTLFCTDKLSHYQSLRPLDLALMPKMGICPEIISVWLLKILQISDLSVYYLQMSPTRFPVPRNF
jgi:hypothetical protein